MNPDDRSDEEIAVAVQQGSADDFGVLIERYEAKLQRYARKFLSRPDDIQDLVQDVFIKSYTNIQSFDAKLSFSPWVYRVAHNVFVNELRRKERRGGFGIFDVDAILPQIPAKETTDGAALQFELQAEMEGLIGQLKPKYREVVVLFYYQHLSYEEISSVLKIPTTTVGVRMTRARAQLKQLHPDNETNT